MNTTGALPSPGSVPSPFVCPVFSSKSMVSTLAGQPPRRPPRDSGCARLACMCEGINDIELVFISPCLLVSDE